MNPRLQVASLTSTCVQWNNQKAQEMAKIPSWYSRKKNSFGVPVSTFLFHSSERPQCKKKLECSVIVGQICGQNPLDTKVLCAFFQGWLRPASWLSSLAFSSPTIFLRLSNSSGLYCRMARPEIESMESNTSIGNWIVLYSPCLCFPFAERAPFKFLALGSHLES